MGFYIELPESLHKAMQLKRDHKAQVIFRPTHFSEIPKGETLICVVENGPFDAAAIIYCQEELDEFAYGTEGRRTTWMLMDTEEVVKMKPHLAEYLRGEKSWRS